MYRRVIPGVVISADYVLHEFRTAIQAYWVPSSDRSRSQADAKFSGYDRVCTL